MDIASEIGTALAREFALPDAGTTTSIVVRLLVATVLGALLGYERERGGHPAGLKTHILVSAGSALFVLVPLLAGASMDATTRVMQGVVQGIGFLGAGAILKQASDDRIQGLTSAAGILLAAAIGMTAGLGKEIAAIIATVIALGVFWLIPWLLPQPGSIGPEDGHDGQHPDQ